MRVQDKSILVTGAGQGIGEGMAERLAREGARVVVNDIDSALHQRVVAGASIPGACVEVDGARCA